MFTLAILVHAPLAATRTAKATQALHTSIDFPVSHQIKKGEHIHEGIDGPLQQAHTVTSDLTRSTTLVTIAKDTVILFKALLKQVGFRVSGSGFRAQGSEFKAFHILHNPPSRPAHVAT